MYTTQQQGRSAQALRAIQAWTIAGISGSFAEFRRRMRHRAEYRDLLELDDHILRDIGVSRRDVLKEYERLSRGGKFF